MKHSRFCCFYGIIACIWLFSLLSAQGGLAPEVEPEPEQESQAVAAVTNNVSEEPWITSPEARAWEDILEANLGNFYLTHYKEAKAKGRETAWDYIEDEPALPRVLLIGDSISRGYTVPVRHLLAGKVNLHRAPRNCGNTKTAFSVNRKLNKEQLELWLGDGRWDLIHFNFGIHDSGMIQREKSTIEEYKERLEEIVNRLKETGARLVFANTTWGRDPDDPIIEVNKAAAEVMEQNNVPINDLYEHMKPYKEEFRIRPDNSHFKGPGYQHLGEKVAEEILKHLPSGKDMSDSRPAGNNPGNSPADARPLRLLIFGASITAYPGRLDIAAFQVSDRLTAQGVEHVFLNSGVPGNTTAMARLRFERDVLGLYPDIVFILLGTNDSAIDVHKGATTPRVSETDYAENLRFFVRELKQRDIQPVFITIPPLYMTERLREIYGRAPYTEKGFNFMVDKYVEIMKEIAESEDVPCLDVNRKFWLAADDDYEKLPGLFSDGMHPNQAGQNIIAKQIQAWLDQYPELMSKRSAYADKVGHLPVKLPQPLESYSDAQVHIKLPALEPAVKAQYRFKPHSGKPRNFGEWTNFNFTFEEGNIKGIIAGLTPGIYSFQFRLLDATEQVAAIGGVDKIRITE